MFKQKSIPANEWIAAKTEEEKQALILKYQEPLSEKEIAELIQQQKDDEELAKKIAKDEAKKAVLNALEEIDRKSVRALREGNQERLSALEAEADKLRQELASL